MLKWVEYYIFSGDMPKYPLPPGDMSSGVAYPTDPGTGIQGMH